MNIAGKPKVSKDHYIVEKIDGVKLEKGKLMFFVKWEGVSINKKFFCDHKIFLIFQKYYRFL